MKALLKLSLLLTILFAGCKEPFGGTPDENPNDHVITQNGYDCENYRYLDFREDDANIKQLLVVNEIVYYITFNREIKAYVISTGETYTLAEDIQTNVMERQGRKVYFCTRSGIFSIGTNDITSYTQESVYSCDDVAVQSDDNILFMGLNLEPDRPFTVTDRVYSVRGIGSVEAVTEGADEQLSSFSVLENGTIIAFNFANNDRVFRFTSDGVLTNSFTEANAPLGFGNHNGRIEPVVVGNKLYAIQKNGLGFARILEWDEASLSWHSYLEESNFESVMQTERWKIFDLIAPTYTGVTIQDNDLYVSTTMAGCRGLIRMRLTDGESLTLENIDIIQDANFEIGHCLQGLQFDEANNRKYVYSQRGLMILEGCR